uniref:Uncharacterized protein n=1 Tax=viral metagenome TaxID=1070528 RepID=A0A6M3II49_9ZZZZ
MKIDVSKELKRLDGQPMQDVGADGNAVNATVKMALLNAVLAPEKDDTPIRKLEKGELARKIYNAEKEVELTAEEISLCKKRIGEVMPSPLVVLQVTEILEQKEGNREET